MKFKEIKCPRCGADINLDVKERKAVFCPFCGGQFAIDDGDKTITHNINIHNRYTNDAAIEKQIRKDRENERNHKEYKWTMIGLMLFIVLDMGLLFLWGMHEDKLEQKKADAGMLQIGQSASEIEGKKYQGIVEQLDKIGFTNVQTVDMNDAGLFKNKEDTIDSITIDGNSTFTSYEYFYPDAKVVITYH